MSEINPIDDRPIQLAELCVAGLNSEFAGTFEAAFNFIEERDHKTLADLCVTVIPGGLESSELIDQGETVENVWLVGIAFQRIVDRKSHDKTKEVLQVVRQVRDWFNRNRIFTIAGADEDYPDQFVIIDIASEPYVSREKLAAGHCFSGLVLMFVEAEDIDE